MVNYVHSYLIKSASATDEGNCPKTSIGDNVIPMFRSGFLYSSSEFDVPMFQWFFSGHTHSFVLCEVTKNIFDFCTVHGSYKIYYHGG